MTIDASVLGLFASSSITTSDPTSTLLGILYGTNTTAAASGGDPVAALESAEQNQKKGVAAAAAEPGTARDIAAFRKAVASATSPAQLLQNPQVLKVLLTANGLGDQASYTALAQKALLSDTTNASSLANTLTNTEWKSTAQTFDFFHKGLSVIQSPTTLDTIANGYAQVQWENSLDATTPGLSSALDFRSRGGTITSADQILGDATFRKVVTTALGIPEQIAFQPLEAQERAITSKVDVSRFSDPAFVDRITKEFLIANQQAAATTATGTASTSLLSLSA